MRLTSAEAINTIHNCAVLYNKNLLGKNVLFVTHSNGSFDYFETKFLARNFKHFTGVVSALESTLFFRAALNNKISSKDINLSKDGVTELKLAVLPTLMNIHVVARMVGDYNYSKSLLITDKIAGTVTSAMGFVKDNNYYVPNTVIKEDMRNLIVKPQRRVAAIFLKAQSEKLYTTNTYVAKGFKIENGTAFELNGVNFKDLISDINLTPP